MFYLCRQMCYEVSVTAHVCITLDYPHLQPAVKASHCYKHTPKKAFSTGYSHHSLTSTHILYPWIFTCNDLTSRRFEMVILPLRKDLCSLCGREMWTQVMDARESLHLCAHKYKEEEISQGCAICCFDSAESYRWSKIVLPVRKSLSDISSSPN